MQLLHQVWIKTVNSRFFQNICMFKSLLSRLIVCWNCHMLSNKHQTTTGNVLFLLTLSQSPDFLLSSLLKIFRKKKEFYFRSGFLLAGRWEEARSSPPAPLTTSCNSHHIKVFKTYQHGGGAAELISDREIAEHKINHNRPAYFFPADSLFDVSLHSW